MDYCEEKLLANGWKTISQNEQCLYEKRYAGKRAILAVYIDDFLLGGVAETRKTAWKEIFELFKMDPQTQIDRFLGIDINVEIA